MKQKWIERPEGGGRTGIRLILAIARFCGRRTSRWLLFPITAYFLLRRSAERRASRAYLMRIFKRRVGLWQVAKHIHCFASITLDRVFLLSENFKRFDVTCHGLEQLHAAMDFGKGVLLYGAHVGSFDALRALSLQRPDVQFRAVIDMGQSPELSEIFNALNPNLASTVIDARQEGIKIAFDIKDALDANAIVTMLVERARPGNAVAMVDFLGSPAAFPTAPWRLAAALKAPIVLCFGLYRGGNRYDLYFESFADSLDIPRVARQTLLQATIRRYADRLAYYASLAPYNWFNFYDFWHPQAIAQTTAPRGADSVDGTRHA